jgi:hypothetical protein
MRAKLSPRILPALMAVQCTLHSTLCNTLTHIKEATNIQVKLTTLESATPLRHTVLIQFVSPSKLSFSVKKTELLTYKS